MLYTLSLVQRTLKLQQIQKNKRTSNKMLSCILLLTASTRYTKITTNTNTAQHWLDLYTRVSCRRRLSLTSIYYYKRLFSDLRCDHRPIIFVSVFLFVLVNATIYCTVHIQRMHGKKVLVQRQRIFLFEWNLNRDISNIFITI